MARPRGPADDLDPDERVEDVAELARWARTFALHMDRDPVPPRPSWLPELGALPPAEMLELVARHDAQAVAEARRFLARPNSFSRRPKEHR